MVSKQELAHYAVRRLAELREKFGSPGIHDQVSGEVKQDELGREVLDPTPMAPPVGYKKQPSMVDIVRDMVRSERLKAEAAAAGYESFEEAEDFDIADAEGDMPPSKWENESDPSLGDLLKAGHEVVKEKSKKPVVKAKDKSKVTPVEDDKKTGESNGDGEGGPD